MASMAVCTSHMAMATATVMATDGIRPAGAADVAAAVMDAVGVSGNKKSNWLVSLTSCFFVILQNYRIRCLRNGAGPALCCLL